MELSLAAKALKATVVLDPAVLVGVVVPNGLAKARMNITVAGRTVTADLNAKSLRRAVAAITEAGPDGVAVVLQGRLEGNALVDAGIAAQPKAPKVSAEAPA